jgi:hypothetical protein
MAEKDLRARFDAELRVAGLEVAGDDRERLFAMWEDFYPQREAFRAAALEPEDEPTFIEKPARLGGGA